MTAAFDPSVVAGDQHTVAAARYFWELQRYDSSDPSFDIPADFADPARARSGNRNGP